MGLKSRGNFLITECIGRDCRNRGFLCSSCLRFSNFVPKESKDCVGKVICTKNNSEPTVTPLS
jgi:hypothetical protein